MPSSFRPSAPVSAPAGGFDRVAWCYDALAALVFGPALRRAQRAALAGLPPGAPQVLILGGGTGWVLLEVLRRRPQATVLYLEASAAMLARAAARLHRQLPQHTAQVAFRHGTQATLHPAERVDALVTFFVLDCFATADFELALQRLAAAARPGAAWLVADFQPARTWWQRLLLALMYRFFRLTTNLAASKLPDWLAALRALGWQPTAPVAEFYGGAVAAATLRKQPATQV